MSASSKEIIEVKIVLLRENETWIAQGLEYDITGHGGSIKAAVDNFTETVFGQAVVDVTHGEKPLANVREAPSFYWQRFEEAQWEWRHETQKLIPRSDGNLPPAYMIGAIEANMRIYD